ncbi:hypothetical protein BJV74DRAFT_952285 [Russula compacta]|nr:hypothetical protein BJV74DRAFT_952285 [Russula compacta]
MVYKYVWCHVIPNRPPWCLPHHFLASDMVNFSDPAIVELGLVALRNFWHTVNGVFIWEFVTTLDYEWSVIQGRRPYGWTIWIYSITRIAALVSVILGLVVLDVRSPYNCQVWVTFGLLSGYLAFATASLLIVFRIIAIWNKNKIVVALATSVWVINVSFIIQGKSFLHTGVARVRSVRDPAQRSCVITNIESSKLNIISTLITATILFLIMLVGLLRHRYHRNNAFGIGRLLWKQGVIWLFAATAAGIPPTVFIILDLNYPLNIMFQPPAVIVMSIAATRMYRSLADFVSDATDIHLIVRDSQIPKTKWSPCMPISLNHRIEVTVDTAYEQYPMTPTSNYGPYINVNESFPGNKEDGLSLENDLESTGENRALAGHKPGLGHP